MQVGVNSQLNFVFFIPYVYIIVSLIFTFSIIRTLNIIILTIYSSPTSPDNRGLTVSLWR